MLHPKRASLGALLDSAFSRRLPLIVLCGPAGSGKTELLRALALRGKQTLDLEALAVHRGSAFGQIPGKAQPSHRTFQAAIARQWLSFDARRRVWTEQEGPYIGSVGLPPMLVERMHEARKIVVAASEEERIKRILRDYASIPDAELERGVARIAPRLGSERTKAVLEALSNHNRRTAIRILVKYYDAVYPANATGAVSTVSPNGDVTASDVIERVLKL